MNKISNKRKLRFAIFPCFAEKIFLKTRQALVQLLASKRNVSESLANSVHNSSIKFIKFSSFAQAWMKKHEEKVQ